MHLRKLANNLDRFLEASYMASGFLIYGIRYFRFGIAALAPSRGCWKTAKICKYAKHMYSFAYVFAMLAASPATIMEPTAVEAAEGRLHYGGWGGGEHRNNICKFDHTTLTEPTRLFQIRNP